MARVFLRENVSYVCKGQMLEVGFEGTFWDGGSRRFIDLDPPCFQVLRCTIKTCLLQRSTKGKKVSWARYREEEGVKTLWVGGSRRESLDHRVKGTLRRESGPRGKEYFREESRHRKQRCPEEGVRPRGPQVKIHLKEEVRTSRVKKEDFEEGVWTSKSRVHQGGSLDLRGSECSNEGVRM